MNNMNNNEIDFVEVTYCTNYNGCYGYIYTVGMSDSDEPEEIKEDITDTIIEHCADDCDDDGEYCGNTKKLTEFVTNLVQTEYGPNVKVVFKLDNVST